MNNMETSQPYGAATSRDLIGDWKNNNGGGYAKGSNSVGTDAMTMSYGGGATLSDSPARWITSTTTTSTSLEAAVRDKRRSVAGRAERPLHGPRPAHEHPARPPHVAPLRCTQTSFVVPATA